MKKFMLSMFIGAMSALAWMPAMAVDLAVPGFAPEMNFAIYEVDRTTSQTSDTIVVNGTINLDSNDAITTALNEVDIRQQARMYGSLVNACDTCHAVSVAVKPEYGWQL